MPHPTEVRLRFAIDEWDPEGNRIIERLATAGSSEVAKAAYQAALVIRPNSRVTLRKGAMLLEERVPQ